MTYFGANGVTKSEIGSALGITGDFSKENAEAKFKTIVSSNPNYVLESANGIFVQKSFPIQQTFTDLVTGSFAANISPLDFVAKTEEARKTINQFANDKTHGKIKDLLPQGVLGPLSRLVLVNAVYFKADWEDQFKPRDTADRPFRLVNGQKKDVKTMEQTGLHFYAFGVPELGGASLLQLKYKGGDTSMIIILPLERTGLRGLEQSLTPETFASAVEKMGRHPVQMFLPRFKVSSSHELQDVMQSLGVKVAFTDKADFNGISDGLSISKVIQKVFVEVTEKGTEAAAATAVIMVETMSMLTFNGPKPFEFKADHPFLFLIRHEPTGQILFMGRVADPTVGSE